MGDFKYKDYSADESKIYDAAMAQIIEGLRNGLSFNEACGVVYIEDKKLKEFIEDDALKIMIADMHYIKGLTLPELASALKVSIESINKANSEMLEDVSITTAEIFKMTNSDSPIGNA